VPITCAAAKLRSHFDPSHFRYVEVFRPRSAIE
jgi:hypothetical protein